LISWDHACACDFAIFGTNTDDGAYDIHNNGNNYGGKGADLYSDANEDQMSVLIDDVDSGEYDGDRGQSGYSDGGKNEAYEANEEGELRKLGEDKVYQILESVPYILGDEVGKGATYMANAAE
jgi:hypothetical protein